MTRPSQAGTPDILELEVRLDTLLWWPRVTAETFVAAQLAATRWFEAAWNVATARSRRGPSELDDTLTPFDRECLTAVLAEGAASLGYELIPLAPWRTRLLRLAIRISSSPVQ